MRLSCLLSLRAGCSGQPKQPPDTFGRSLQASLQAHINGLRDPDRSARRRSVSTRGLPARKHVACAGTALPAPERAPRLAAFGRVWPLHQVEQLHAALFGTTRLVPEALQPMVAGVVAPVVLLLADPAEKCRELAVAFLSTALQRVAEPGALMPTVLRALAERVGRPPAREESEEMRLALAQLVSGPLLRHAPRPLPADLLPPLCSTVCGQLQDAYADIKQVGAWLCAPSVALPSWATIFVLPAKRDSGVCAVQAACAAVVGLAGAARLPPAVLEPLVLALGVNLLHQHSRVRLAGVQAVHALVLHGMPLALMQEHVLPAVRPLAHDHSPAIRAALVSCMAQWAGGQLSCSAGSAANAGGTAGQCQSFLPLVLPLLLLGLTDEAENIRSDAFAQLEAVSARMAGQVGCTCVVGSTTHHKGLYKHPSPRQPRWAAQAHGAEPQVDVQLGRGWPGLLPGYCHPFTAGRPSRAARRLVQAHLSMLLQQALGGLREWTGGHAVCSVGTRSLQPTADLPCPHPAAALRASAARVLHATLIHSEAEALPQLPALLQALSGAVLDDDASVARHAVACVHVLGVNLPPGHWMPLAAQSVAVEQQSSRDRVAALVVLAALLHAASRSGAEPDAATLQLAVAALGQAEHALAAASDKGLQLGDTGPARQQLLIACSSLGQWAGASLTAVAPQLFQVLLQAYGVQQGSPPCQPAEPHSLAAATLAEFAAWVGRKSPAVLCGEYGSMLLQTGIEVGAHTCDVCQAAAPWLLCRADLLLTTFARTGPRGLDANTRQLAHRSSAADAVRWQLAAAAVAPRTAGSRRHRQRSRARPAAAARGVPAADDNAPG